MKSLALIAAVVFTTLTLESCRQPDDLISNEEAATLKKVQASSLDLKGQIGTNNNVVGQNNIVVEDADGETVRPPKK